MIMYFFSSFSQCHMTPFGIFQFKNAKHLYMKLSADEQVISEGKREIAP